MGKLARFLNVHTLWRTDTEVATEVNYVYGCSRCLAYVNNSNETAEPEILNCIEYLVNLLKKCFWSPNEMLEVDKYIRNYYDEYKRRLHETQINEVEKDEVNTDTKEVGLKSTSPNNAKKKPAKNIVPLISNQIVSLAPLLATDLTWLSISLHLTAVKCSRPIITTQFYFQSLYNEVIKTITNDKQSNSSISTGINEHKKVTCPIITIFNCPGRIGALQSGKCRFLQEVLLIPKPYLKPKELLNNLLLIRTNLSQYLLNKTNLLTQIICDNGATSVNIDKPEQCLEILIELLEQLQLNNEFYFGLYITPKGVFDTVKERYEIITGSLKTPEELVNYYVDLITRYPQIRLLIDPFRAEDKECWELLRTRITFPILITTSTTIQPSMKLMIPNRSNSIATKNSTIIQTTNLCNELIQFSTSTGLSIYELINCQDNNEHVNDQQINDTSLQTMPIINSTDKHSLYYSAWLFTLDTCLDCVLVTEVIQAVYKMHKENRQVIFSLDNLNVFEDWPMDMAISLGIDFIKITGLNRIDQMNKLLAWYNYYEEEDIMNEWKLYDSSLLEESI
ncbi:Enolase 4 isoform 1 [Schistosoma japonicum]|nr:Enolase 4 isoform 1 [Schistosoma japonicum]